MNKRQIAAILILLSFVASTFKYETSVNINNIVIGSPSSGEIPPPSGGEDTGGGSAAGGLYLNYRIPLIFRSGPYGPTIIEITTIYDQVPLIFDVELVGYNSTVYLDANQTLTLDCSEQIFLENGSLIQTFVPLQINVFHESQSSVSDDTFSYSVLVMSMWGDEYQSPYDNMKAKIVSGFNNSEVTIINNGEPDIIEEIEVIGQSIDVNVKVGTIIKGSGPIGVVFYSLSLDEGSFAFTGIPYYLWGKDYYTYPPPDTSSIPLLDGDVEITLSTIYDYGNIFYYTDFDTSGIVTLQSNSTATLTRDIIPPGEYFHHLNASYTDFSISLLYNYTINGIKHKAGIQYISSENMMYGEVFYSDLCYSNQKMGAIVLKDGSEIIPMYLEDNGTIVYDIDGLLLRSRGNILTFDTNTTIGFIGTGYFFSKLASTAPEDQNWNSSANVLYPMNIVSYFGEVDEDSADIFSWYRFPNLNVKSVSVSPSNVTEFRRLQIDFIIQNNGSILSAPFWVTLALNDTIKLRTQIESLDVNETFALMYDEFQGLGLRVWNVSIFVDSGNQIYELYEFDNTYQLFIEVERNMNIIFAAVGIAVIIVLTVFYFIGKRLKKYVKRRKRRFDIILSDIEV